MTAVTALLSIGELSARTGRPVRTIRFFSGTDARAERYWQLLAMVNGWPPVPTTVPAWEWFIAALRAR